RTRRSKPVRAGSGERTRPSPRSTLDLTSRHFGEPWTITRRARNLAISRSSARRVRHNRSDRSVTVGPVNRDRREEVKVRELRVVGLEPDAKHVVLADPATGDKFRIPVDDTLRAAARGDLARLGQIQIETTSQLRPREIQARIRGGASVEQVADEAGIPVAKVERFAYPVLLERSRAADMAKKGHPVRPDGPAVETLQE